MFVLVATALSAMATAMATAPFAAAQAGPRGATPKLNRTFARALAEAKVRRFEARSAVIAQVNFEGCERGSPHKVRCAFYGRGTTRLFSRVCDIAVVVQGTGTEASAKLKPACKSIPRLLTFARAIPAIERAAAERIATRVALSAIRRIDPTEIEATATWSPPTAPAEECTATFYARLNTRDLVNVPSFLHPCKPAGGYAWEATSF